MSQKAIYVNVYKDELIKRKTKKDNPLNILVK